MGASGGVNSIAVGSGGAGAGGAGAGVQDEGVLVVQPPVQE